MPDPTKKSDAIEFNLPPPAAQLDNEPEPSCYGPGGVLPMAAEVLPIDTIVCDPDIRGGRPIVAETSLRVSDIAAYHIYGGLAPEKLAVQFNLDLAQVYAALSYYFAHRAEIQGEIQENADQADKWWRISSRVVEEGNGL